MLEGFRSLYIKDNFSFDLVPLYTTESKNIVSVISVVNLIVGSCKFASSKKVTMSGLKTV